MSGPTGQTSLNDGAASDPVTTDVGASGASFTFVSMFKGMVSNLLSIRDRLPASLGGRAGSASLSVVPATDAVFPAPADQDPIFDHAAGVKTSVNASTLVITPPAGCKYLRISGDGEIAVSTAGVATVVDDGTAIRIVANAPEVIPVVPGVAVRALSLSGSAVVVRATPMKVRG